MTKRVLNSDEEMASIGSLNKKRIIESSDDEVIFISDDDVKLTERNELIVITSSDEEVVEKKRRQSRKSNNINAIVATSSEDEEEVVVKPRRNNIRQKKLPPKKIVMDETTDDEDGVMLIKEQPAIVSDGSSVSSLGDVSDGELNDLIGIVDSHVNHKQLILSTDDEDDNFVDNNEQRRVLMPLQYRFVSNQEWFIIYCQYLYTNDLSSEEAIEAKKRYENKINHLLLQLKSQRWEESLAKELRESDSFKSYSIESVEGCDVCRLGSRTSTFEIQLDINSYYTGRFCLERARYYQKVAHMIEDLKSNLVSMQEEYLSSLYDTFQDQIDLIETYIQKGMDK